MKHLKTYQQFENKQTATILQDMVGDYGVQVQEGLLDKWPYGYSFIWAVYDLSNKVDNWTEYEHTDTKGYPSFTQYTFEHPITGNKLYGSSYDDFMSKGRNSKAFQEWFLQNTQLHNMVYQRGETYWNAFQRDHKNPKSSFQWHPDLLDQYQHIFKTKRTGVV